MQNTQGIKQGDTVYIRLAGHTKNRLVRGIDSNGNVLVNLHSNTRFIVYDREITSFTKGGR